MLDMLKQARAAFSLLNPQEVLHRAQIPVRIGLVAADPSGYAQLEDFLGSQPGDSNVFRASDPVIPDDVEVVLCAPGIDAPRGAFGLHPEAPTATVVEILSQREEFELALARQFPVFRKAVVDGIVHAVAKENALFAVTTALPDVLPSLIELPWAMGEWASDTAFLTVNQVRMAFQIAAASGREVGFQHQKTEILSIAAGAFGWRAIARELVGKIPFGGGLIPKGAVAYAGTYAVGKGLERLYNGGRGLTRGQFRDLYRNALDRGHHVAGKLLGGAHRPETLA
ncbi:MAG: hypothetical protein ACLQVN_15860 [Bryobacteraceae bacterium]